jgi:hypothetical protein
MLVGGVGCGMEVVPSVRRRSMSDADAESPKTDGHPPWMWAIWLSGALAVYLLGAPVLDFYLADGDPFALRPRWASPVLAPWNWLRSLNWASGPMANYERWCWEALSRLKYEGRVW